MVNERVAFQGEPGAYSEMAALRYFPNAQLVPMKSFQDLFDNVESNKINFSIVPIENSIEGKSNFLFNIQPIPTIITFKI